jgi:NAD(P)-dependent dehydrogenase (short-subunit alcohol dehydrogenase family)
MYNLVDLSNKHIVITGASSGIGRAIALLCNKLGANISLIGRNIESLNSVLNLMAGSKNYAYEFDVCDLPSMDKLIVDIVSNIGPIDGFVHSAGIEMTRPIKMLKSNHYSDVFNTNTISALELTKYITKSGNVSSNASIVYISSIVGILGQAGKTAYSASKAALIGASKCLALELAPRGIRVNTILPAVVETNMSKNVLDSLSEENKNNILKMHPLGFGKPDDIANSAVFLLSSASNWITGVEFIVDGGYSAS